jgi:O-antigen/teichoic acid export membrane protein
MTAATTNTPTVFPQAAESLFLGPPQPARPSFTANLATVFGGQAACAAVALGIEVCYARLLGPAGRGQVSLCMMVIVICTVLGGLGGEIPIVIWTAGQKKSSAEWLPAVFFLGLLGSASVSGLWWIVYWWWHPVFLHGITPPLAAIVFAAIPITVFFAYFVALVTGMERFPLRAGVSLTSKMTELVGIIALAFLIGRSAQMAIIGNLLGLLVAGALAVFFLRESLRGMWKRIPSPPELRAALSLGMRGQLGNVAAFFSYRLDVFVVNYFLDPAQVGLYALGVVIAESLWQIPQAAAVALFPRTARTIGQGAEEFTCFVTRQVLVLACLLGLLIALLSPVVIPLVFGVRFAPSAPVIWWILPGTIALALGKVMSADITARGKPEFNSMVAIAGGALTVILDFILIPRMGIRGAALASSITYFLEALLIGFTLKHLLKVNWKTLLVPSSSDLASYFVVWKRWRS